MNSVPYPEYVPEDFPCPSDKAMVLGVFDPDLKGCFPINIEEDRVQIHACFPKENRGQFAINAAKQAFRWVFLNTEFDVIFSKVRERHVGLYARLCGMTCVNGHYEVKRWSIL